jgi:hypothetical protein
MTLRSGIGPAIYRLGMMLDLPASTELAVWRRIAEAPLALTPQQAGDRLFIEEALGELVKGRAQALEGPVLIDAMWRNANFLLRSSFLRAALGTASLEEYALTGRFRSREQAQSLARTGVARAISLQDNMGSLGGYVRQARALIKRTDNAGEILDWKLPGDVHGCIVYDHLLKRKRVATLDIKAPGLDYMLADVLAELDGALAVLDRIKPKLVVVSHTVQASFGALAWIAAARGVPVIYAHGNYGALRFFRMRKPTDIFDVANLPAAARLDAIEPAQAQALGQAGENHIRSRLAGATNDLGAQYAFVKNADRPDRKQICAQFGWNPEKPIVAVYAANWFDYPHTSGMPSFRDYLDWLECTLAGARANENANWLFRAHPCDAWYGGITLSDLMGPGEPKHLGRSPTGWNGSAVLEAADAVVTVLGTAGLEYACLGKPALAADRGWYSDCGFARASGSRAEYGALLRAQWWRDWPADTAMRRARIAAGIHFAMPADQPGIVYADDSEQERAYPWQGQLLAERRGDIEHEIARVRRWWQSDEPAYQIFKMLEARAFKPAKL